MKIKTKTNYLLGILLSTFLIVGIINVTGAKTIIDTNPDSYKLHTPSLFKLFIGNDSNSAEMSVDTGSKNLDILNGLIIGTNHTGSQSLTLSVIGGGKDNKMYANYAGIGGGEINKIYQGSDNGAIGGGFKNTIGSGNNAKNGVIAGGANNTDEGGGIILGGYNNQIASLNEGGIILGGQNNRAGTQSLILGSAKNPISRAPQYSFIWNQKEFRQHSGAYINAESGMLINTLNPIKGVSLVVSGSTKLGPNNNSNSTGGVFVDSTGCVQFYDGNVYNTLGKISEGSGNCGINTGCQFGAVTLHHGDIVTAYSVSYTGNCLNASGQVICTNGNMVDYKNQNSHNYIYPYCYNLSPDPTIDVLSGYQNCTGLPENAEWVNQYFEQKLLNGNTYSVQPAATHISEGKSECTYKCISDEYQYKDGKCLKCEGGQIPGANATKSDLTPSSIIKWKYVSPNTQLQACQWTCTGDYIKDQNSNDCVQKPDSTPDVAYLINGYDINNKMKELTDNHLGRITNFKMYTGNPNSIPSSAEIISTDEGKEVKMWYDNGTMYYYTDADIIYLNKNSSSMFSTLGLTEVDLSKFDTSKVEYMNNMFFGCTQLKSIDFSKGNWNTNSVKNMSMMFRGCINMENLDLSGWNTSNVTNMDDMFSMDISNCYSNCPTKLTNLNVSTRDTSNVTSMKKMFGGCNSLQKLDLSGWNTSNVTNMYHMFRGCKGLTELNVSTRNTSKVTNMEMTFSLLENLKELDLSNWNTSKVTNMDSMFGGSKNIEKIYASEKFDTSNVYTTLNVFSIFNDNDSLEGGNGTRYNENHQGKEYARLDCGPSAPGYFSSKTPYSCNNQEPLPEPKCGDSLSKKCINSDSSNENINGNSGSWTCSNGQSSVDCTYSCRKACPNGYQLNGNTCTIYKQFCYIHPGWQSQSCFGDTDSDYQSDSQASLGDYFNQDLHSNDFYSIVGGKYYTNSLNTNTNTPYLIEYKVKNSNKNFDACTDHVQVFDLSECSTTLHPFGGNRDNGYYINNCGNKTSANSCDICSVRQSLKPIQIISG